MGAIARGSIPRVGIIFRYLLFGPGCHASHGMYRLLELQQFDDCRCVIGRLRVVHRLSDVCLASRHRFKSSAPQNATTARSVVVSLRTGSPWFGLQLTLDVFYVGTTQVLIKLRELE